MPVYTKVMADAIVREQSGVDFVCHGEDRQLLRMLIDEVNAFAGTNYQYLAELAMFTTPGIGNLVVRYIEKFSSESVRGYLLHHVVSDKVKNSDKLVLKWYKLFKLSDEYISAPGIPAPSHIYTRYDSAIKATAHRQLKDEIVQLASCPRDFFYLPCTMKMLASWKFPEVKNILVRYARENNISEQDVGINKSDSVLFPPFSFICREIRFTAIDGLKFYPSPQAAEIIRSCVNSPDVDIRSAAKKTLRRIERNIGNDFLA